MNVLERLQEIMRKQNLNANQLCKLANIPTSTFSNMKTRNTTLTIPILSCICDALDISLAQFFVEDEEQLYPVTSLQKEFLDYFILLTEEEQNLLLEMVKLIKR